jgi:lysozyme
MNLDLSVGLCRRFEGFKSKPYLCPAGIPTIGFGTTIYPDGRRVTLNDPACTESQAVEWMLYELRAKCLIAVLRLCPKATDINVINALVDFVYNLGAGRLQTSTLRRKINDQNWRDAINEILKWNRGGGRILPGLVLRRKAEAALISAGTLK